MSLQNMQTQFKQALAGVGVCSVLMLLISWPLGYLSLRMAAGILLGDCTAMFNLYLIARSIERVVQRPAARARRYMFTQYLMRYALMGLVITIGLKSKFLNPAGVILPLFFPKLTFHFVQLSGHFKKGAN